MEQSVSTRAWLKCDKLLKSYAEWNFWHLQQMRSEGRGLSAKRKTQWHLQELELWRKLLSNERGSKALVPAFLNRNGTIKESKGIWCELCQWQALVSEPVCRELSATLVFCHAAPVVQNWHNVCTCVRQLYSQPSNTSRLLDNMRLNNLRQILYPLLRKLVYCWMWCYKAVIS